MDRPSPLANHPDRKRWNERYRDAGPAAFGSRASEWLEEHRALLQENQHGRALDLACGNGRNAFFLAELGYTVDAVDISEVAIEWVDAKSRDHRLAVEALQLNLETDPFPKGDYQVILNLNYLERSIFDRIRSSLVSGGLLIFQTRSRDHVDRRGGDTTPEFALDSNELLHAFTGSDFRVLHYRESIVTEGSDGRQRALAGLVAQRT